MIGELNIAIDLKPRTGDKLVARAHALAPDGVDWHFNISFTGTVEAMWALTDNNSEAVIGDMARELLTTIIGTGKQPPNLTFDSYNSESSVKATLDKVRNLGISLFLQDRSAGDEIAAIFGGAVASEIEQANSQFIRKIGLPLVGPLDYAFEMSEAINDLSTPPTTKAEFLYRVCILSVIIDSFCVRLPNEKKKVKSLEALKNYLTEKFGREKATELTEAFRQIKGLRKQYPIHEHFERDAAGQKVVRHEVERAQAYFGFRAVDDFASRWKKVVDSFRHAVADLSVHVKKD